jgi:hypothetical protein
LGKIGQTSAQAGTKAEGQARAIAGAKAGPKPLAKAKKKPSMGELLRHPARVIKNRLRESKRAGQQPSPSDYGELAKAWELLGADSGQVPARLAIRDLRLRLLVFLLTGLLATWGIWHGGPGFLAVPVILATLVGAATSLWRLSLLKEKRFVSFPSWLKSGCGALASRNSGPCQRESADQDGQGDQVAFAENGTSVGQNTLNHETAMVAKEAIAMETKETL